MSQIKSIGEIEAKGFVRQADGSYRKQRLCANNKEPACHPGSDLGNTTNRPSESEATRGDLSGVGAACGSTANGMTPKTGTRIRQSKKPLMNKLEQSFWNERLSLRYPKAKPQAVRFKLGNGVNYTPDFVDLSVQPVKAWEVKGPHSWDDAMVKLKLAAAIWAEVRWRLVWKKDGQWMEQEVLP